MSNVKKRDTHKNSILKIVKFANGLNDKTEEEEVVVRLDLLHTVWNQFQEEHFLVLETTGKEELDFQAVEYDSVEDSVVPAIARMSKFLKDCKAKRKEEEASSSSSGSRGSSPGKGSSGGLRVPHFRIPMFSGKYDEWPSFRDMFVTLVDENERMKAPQKLGFLKSNLCGEALTLVNNLALTEANYKDAWDLIKERYNNERILVSKLLLSIYSLPVSKGRSEDIRRLLDSTTEAIRGLKNLKRPTDQWDDWFVFLVELKLDENTKLRWEETIGAQPDGKDSKVQSWSTLESFLKARFRSLEVNQPLVQRTTLPAKPFNASGSSKGCPQCSKDHRLSICFDFKKKSVVQRQQLVRQRRLCENCLSGGHLASNCENQYTCRMCQGRHHTLLHPESGFTNPPRNANAGVLAANQGLSAPARPTACHIRAFHPQKELLATALVLLQSKEGGIITMRALVDPCSHLSFITQKAIRQILVEMHPVDCSYATFGELESTGRALAAISFGSRLNQQAYEMFALVVPTITGQLPLMAFQLENENPLNKLALADPTFNVPGEIDVLLGTGIYAEIVENGLIKHGKMIAQKTTLGWILLGTQANLNRVTGSVVHPVLHCKANVDDQLKAFWELEEMVNDERRLSVEDQICESHFESTYRKLQDGRFEVQLPFKKLFGESLKLGYTRNIAISSYLRLEKRFSKDAKLKRDYQQVINELLAMNHLEEIPESEVAKDPAQSYYLPHHPVLNEESSTTKLRVVFNASQKSSTGLSLNDVTMTGPSLQNDLFDILLHIRQFRVAFTADVAKMYRQIWVAKEHCDYQRIVWRKSPNEPIQDFRLCTVTYGTSSATYIALKVVETIVKAARECCPLAAEIASNLMYMDNIFAGTHETSTALVAKQQLEKLFSMARFELRKWASNSTQFMESIPTNLCETPIYFNGKGFIKTLGSFWDPAEDQFRYRIQIGEPPVNLTKRKLLSEASGLFDPLGLVAPSIVIAKMQFQELWKTNLDWDDKLPEGLKMRWLEFRADLPRLEDIKIPRWLGNCSSEILTEIHGFSDASRKAYAAVIYTRVIRSDGSVQVTLLTSKTKVSPLKTITIDRLELCGAVLLSRVLKRVIGTMKYNNSETFAWSDSMTVLYWLQSDPSRWKSFVANRAAEISSTLPGIPWSYVNTKENPADCASRGLLPSKLVNHELWWSGPKWLTTNKGPWCQNSREIVLDPNIDLEERKVVGVTAVVTVQWDLRMKYSSLLRLLRVTAWILRFVNNCRIKSMKNESKFLKPEELEASHLFWIKVTQRLHFSNELVCLEDLDELPRKSPLRSLAPQIDQNGVLRLGGRLRRSKRLTEQQKFPIILPSKDHFTKLLLDYAHDQTLHGNVQSMRVYLRQRYWILKDRATIRYFVRRCEVCFAYIAKPAQQLMADLPRPRIDPEPARAFAHTGVDYAGPLKVKMQKKNLSYVLSDGYIAVFVCMATKAIHLEGVMDQTARSFIAAFHRMKSRRGQVSHMYSDNGRNFVGAARLLTEDLEIAIAENEEIWAAELANEGVLWHFNPPGAPHHGGLFEAGVRSMKYHLRRVLQTHNLTYEELTTVLCQVEAVLNSRPLCALTDDPSDEDVLTPGHFLIGTSLLAAPEPNLLSIKENRLDRWQLVQQLHQRLWKLWSSDYLSNLQQRGKWQQQSPNMKVGELVLLIDDNMPPGKWLRARVIEVYPDSLGLVRQVMIRCQGHTYLRPITKLCSLPCNEDEESMEREEIPQAD